MPNAAIGQKERFLKNPFKKSEFDYAKEMLEDESKTPIFDGKTNLAKPKPKR